MTFLGWQNEWGLFFAPKWNNEFCVWHSNKRGVCDWKRSNWENIEARLSSSENEVTSSKPLKSFISSTLNLNYLIFCCLFGLFNAIETPFSSPLYLQHKRKWQNPMCIFQLFWFCCCFCYSVGGFLRVEKKTSWNLHAITSSAIWNNGFSLLNSSNSIFMPFKKYQESKTMLV